MQSSSDHDTQPIWVSRLIGRDRPIASQPRLWPLMTFWASAAFFFAISSVLSAVRFMGILLDASESRPVLAMHHFAWLGAAVFLFFCSAMSLALALLILGRHASGLYGSLLFGLLLTLIAPLVGLLVPQPNYLGVICVGIIPAASVLYTLLNMEGFLKA